jgi:hypothetical protein
MKSKFFLLAFIFVLTAATSYSQIPEVMVGDTAKIVTFVEPYYQGSGPCSADYFSIARHFNLNFSYITHMGSRPMSDSNGYFSEPDTAIVFFLPDSTGIQTDSAIFWSLWKCGAPGHNLWFFSDSIRSKFIAKGIDSVVVIKIKDSSITLPIDTQARKYKSKTEPFYFYSNIADSVLFDNWQLIVDPTAKINFAIDSGSAPIAEYYSKPFTRKKQLNFTFTSGLLASDTAHSFPVTMKTRVRYKGIDSIYSNNFTIILPSAPKSGVPIEKVEDISFTINPNPFSKSTTLTVTTPQRDPITIEIYDILGRRKVIIAHNEIVGNVHTFHFETSGLQEGTYYARLVCNGQIITKKIFIEK